MLQPGFGHGWEMLNVARSLAESGTFQNPLLVMPTGPTAMVPPGYPLLLSFFIRLFGDGLGLAWSAVILSILGYGLYVSLLPAAGESLTGDPGTGRAAALLAVIIPAFPLMPQWDTILTSAGLLGYLILARPGLSLRSSLGLGAFAGFLSLWNPISALAAFLRVLYLAPRNLAALALLGMWGAGYVAVSGPWMVRNYVVLGTWSPRTNLGTTLYVSNNDCAAPDRLETLASGCYSRNNANTSQAEAGLILSMGEAAYNSMRVSDSLGWMAANPSKTVRLAAARGVQYWFPDATGQAPYAQAVWLITALSIVGFVWMASNGVPGWGYMLATCLVVPLPYYFVITDIRYRAPILWVAQITGGYVLARLWSRWK